MMVHPQLHYFDDYGLPLLQHNQGATIVISALPNTKKTSKESVTHILPEGHPKTPFLTTRPPLRPAL
jgi:hypothetical protein